MPREKFKGFNVPVYPNTPTDTVRKIQAIADWGGNVVRIQLNDDPSLLPDMDNRDAYSKWLDSKLDAVAIAAQAGKQYGVKIIVSQHQPFGGVYTNPFGMPRYKCLRYTPYKDAFVEDWSRIAWQFTEEDTILGYDLLNEPLIKRSRKYMPLMLKAAESIRVIEKNKKIIFSTPYGNPARIKTLNQYATKMKELRKVWVTAHMYWPMHITHQGIPVGNCRIKYPVGGSVYPHMGLNAEHIKKFLTPLQVFRKLHRIPVFIGEYSCVRWSGYPVRDNTFWWLKDTAGVMDSFGFHWTYHAFEEAGMWRLDYNTEPCADVCNPHCQQTPKETERVELMKTILKG